MIDIKYILNFDADHHYIFFFSFAFVNSNYTEADKREFLGLTTNPVEGSVGPAEFKTAPNSVVRGFMERNSRLFVFLLYLQA